MPFATDTYAIPTTTRRVERAGCLHDMQNTVEDNFRVWNDDYEWPQDGDEWDGQARACGQPYAQWKQSVCDRLLLPNLTQQTVALEIGPGHGRWSQVMAPACGALILVDLSPNCMAYCQKRLVAYSHIRYVVNDGKTLTGIADESIDFIWSFDCFVHLEADVLTAYLREIKRVLRRRGKAMIHHAGRHHWLRHLHRLEYLGRWGRCSYDSLSLGCWSGNDGERSHLSKRAVLMLSQQAGLTVEAQFQYWGEQEQFGVPRYGDWITALSNNQTEG